MNEITYFHNDILNRNPKIVEHYTNNPRDVIKLLNLDIDILKGLAHEFYKALINEELTPYNKTQITRTLVATILAIRKLEKEENKQVNKTI